MISYWAKDRWLKRNTRSSKSLQPQLQKIYPTKRDGPSVHPRSSLVQPGEGWDRAEQAQCKDPGQDYVARESLWTKMWQNMLSLPFLIFVQFLVFSSSSFLTQVNAYPILSHLPLSLYLLLPSRPVQSTLPRNLGQRNQSNWSRDLKYEGENNLSLESSLALEREKSRVSKTYILWALLLALCDLNLFSFCFDEIEHQLTLEELQNLNALFQVGIDKVNF